ncbi:copine-5 [Gracilinanus agilis]|uniref:copine-5 n=1 Tax=Gracilinanus agilis TaxID=191870 RepID=UPI001CFEAF36|nr:copine-5 [Gracilinanus agilis]
MRAQNIQCSNLLDKDMFSKSDPLCVMYTQGMENKQWREFGRTEVIDNTLNPDFVRKFILDYFFEEKQNIRFDLYDVDSKSPDLSKHDFLGQAFCTLGEIVGSPGSRLEKPLTIGTFSLNARTGKHIPSVSNGGVPGKKCGTIILSVEELSNCRVLQVVNPKKKMKKKKYMNSGTVPELMWKSSTLSTFLGNNYSYSSTLRTQINFTVAIDFTASNGNPSQSTSLHYMSPYQLNAYALALTAVGEIIQDYDSDKMFPALGFGAKLPPDGRVSHEFPLNGNPDNPSCCGIDGILEAYHRSLRTVQLYGPTNFAPVVTHVARHAATVQDGSQYSVLLIITDGVISDMAQTKEAIVNAAKLPMSIIIVGVGQAEFDAMVELDGDDIRISSRGKLAERDIVQFVPFRDYVDRTGNHVLSMARLARDVLAEIPDQLVSYMKAQGIRPRPPPGLPANSPPGSPPHTSPASPMHTNL